MSPEVKQSEEYNASNFEVLEGLEGVRRRPAMYIGSTDQRGLQHCLWEILDNSVDEALAGFCHHIEVVLHADGSVEVHDDGRGIPVDIEPKTGLSGLRVVFERLHAGGKFGGGAYGVAGGLHGVGAAVVNALSNRLDVVSTRNGKRTGLSFRRGIAGKFAKDGSFTPDNELVDFGSAPKEEHGTRVRYWVDDDVFSPTAEIDFEALCDRARQSVYLVSGLSIVVTDDRGDNERVESFSGDGGIAALVEDLAGDEAIIEPISISGSGTFEEVIVGRGEAKPRTITRDVGVEIALRWGTGYATTLRSFVNVVETRGGGTHVSGFEKSLTKALSDAISGTRMLKADESISKEDVMEGMTAVVVVRLPEPQFEGQTKDALATTEVLPIVASCVSEAINSFLNDSKRKADSRRVMEKISRATKARLAARLQRDVLRRKTALETSKLPSKLADCRSEDVTRNEILIVEGDSAMGCLSGSTLVATVDAGPLSFVELVNDFHRGVVHKGYASDDLGDPVLVDLDEPRLTSVDAEVLTITLDNGESVACTPDHLFRLRCGDYRRADALAVGDSLMPLYSTVHSESGDSVILLNSSGQWVVSSTLGACDKVARWDSHALANHKVVCSERSWSRADVYDLTVKRYHNFALAAGVFVHNSAKAARDSEFQALLPIRGKILNTWRATEKQMLENAECAAIISALGAGSGQSFNLENMRYGRFVTLTDADVDGHHIRTLLLTLCWRYMRPLIEAGRAYASVPPLYRVTLAHSGEHLYTYSDEEQAALLARLRSENKRIKDGIQRYKGLGEMSADQLAETTMYPGKRRLRRLTVADAKAASDCFETLMGNDASERRRFIVDKGGIVDPSRLDV